jgi:hypothetical protein
MVSSGKIKVNAEITATNIVIGAKDETIAQAVEMATGNLIAEEQFL